MRDKSPIDRGSRSRKKETGECRGGEALASAQTTGVGSPSNTTGSARFHTTSSCWKPKVKHECGLGVPWSGAARCSTCVSVQSRTPWITASCRWEHGQKASDPSCLSVTDHDWRLRRCHLQLLGRSYWALHLGLPVPAGPSLWSMQERELTSTGSKYCGPHIAVVRVFKRPGGCDIRWWARRGSKGVNSLSIARWDDRVSMSTASSE